MTRTTRWMSDGHEAFLAELIGGQVQPGSGNQFNGQMDVRNDSFDKFALALDGKSTMGKSITITQDTIIKAMEQSHFCEPGIGLRWYFDETGRNTIDWIAVPAAFFRELLEEARGSK